MGPYPAVWFQLSELSSSDHPQVPHSVLLPPLKKLPQPRELLGLHCHYHLGSGVKVYSSTLQVQRSNFQLHTHLSTHFVRDLHSAAVVVDHVRSSHTQLGLQRARRIVDPGVDHPTVVAGLVAGWENGCFTRRSLFVHDTPRKHYRGQDGRTGLQQLYPFEVSTIGYVTFHKVIIFAIFLRFPLS